MSKLSRAKVHWVLAAFYLPILLALGISCGLKAAKPNVLLVTFDTTRADHVGCYGYAKAQTPVLDRLASEGVLFENAFCQAPLTLPSHASILTGLYPPHTGVRLNGPYILPGEIPTLAFQLKQKGYTTAAFVSAFVLHSQFGLNQGFDVYDDKIGGSAQLYIPEQKGEETAAKAIAWLDKNPKKPFFLWVHFFDPHSPYDPPEPYRAKFKENPYDGEISYADEMLGRILSALEKQGVSDSTLVMATADHGEGLGDHAEDSHSFFVYDSTLRVPLIVRLPKGKSTLTEKWKPGTRSKNLVESTDIVPTVLQLTGLKPKSTLDGRNLFSDQTDKARTAYAETLYPLSLGWCPLQTVRNADWKYIQAPDPELYNVISDPSETTNVYQTSKEESVQLAKLLSQLASDSAKAQSKAKGLSPEVAAGLRDLGYISTGVVERSADELMKLPDPKTRVKTFDEINNARYLCRSNRDREAVDKLTPLLEGEKDNPVFNQILGAAYTRLGEYAEGLKYLTHYKDLAAGDLEASLYLGIALLRSGSPEQAVDPLKECVDTLPTYAQAWDQIAVAYGSIGKTDLALEAGKRAVALDSVNADYLKNLGVTLLRVNQPGQAAAQFSKAIESKKDSADLHYHLGLALKALGRYQEASKSYEEALRIQPDFWECKQRLVESSYQANDRARAKTLAEELVQANEAGAVARFYLGLIRIEAKEWPSAIENLEIAVREMPGFPPAYQALAEAILESQVDKTKAAWLLEQAKEHSVNLRDDVKTRLEELSRK